jgi:hypothetical protein
MYGPLKLGVGSDKTSRITISLKFGDGNEMIERKTMWNQLLKQALKTKE